MNEPFSPPRLAWAGLVLLVTALAFYAMKAQTEAIAAKNAVDFMRVRVDRMQKHIEHIEIERR